jgi:hypothetical protein
MFNAILRFGWDNVAHEILAQGLTEEEALEMESAQIAMHSQSSTLYNISGIPAQCLAQENTHFIDSTEQPTIHTTNKPSTRTYGTGYIIPLTTKPVGVHICAIDVYTKDGTFICTYPSAKVAAHELGVNHGDVTSCCKGVKADGQPKYQVKGYIFRYHI